MFLNAMAVVTNAFLLGFTHADFSRWLMDAWGEGGPQWFVILFEHVLFLLMFALSTMIPDIPAHVLFKTAAKVKKTKHAFGAVERKLARENGETLPKRVGTSTDPLGLSAAAPFGRSVSARGGNSVRGSNFLPDESSGSIASNLRSRSSTQQAV
jgi:hypothetical protein